MPIHKLNLGCGTHILSGYVNLDISPLPGVDVVHNIETLPLPFPDNHFTEILCQDVLEHVEYPRILRDLYRCLAPGGMIKIRVPHFTSRHNFIDPTHKKMFSIETFDFFVNNQGVHQDRSYYFDFAFASCARSRIVFDHDSPVFFLNYAIEPLVNMSVRAQRIYEATGWSRLFPAMNIEVTLVK